MFNIRTVPLTLVPLVLLAATAQTQAKGDPPSYHLVVEFQDTDGSPGEKVYDGAFSSLPAAFDQAERIHRNGYCFPAADPPIPDPLLAAYCYPPARILRVRVLLY